MIKKIIHLSDIHIRTYQLHEQYKKQFQLLIETLKLELKDIQLDEIRIVITGDIAHQKINISNEQIILTSWLLSELSKLGKVVIIPGNHDFLENNIERVDSITPIVELLNNPNIIYYKNGGVYNDNNINWVVYSLYQHNQRPEFERVKNQLYVGLFHGPIEGLSTDMGYQFEDAYDRLNFIDLDLLLCGDVHKRQTFLLSNGKKGVMIGSFLQQNFGETIKHHGYGIYDVEDDEYIFRDLNNDQPYYHFKIRDINDIVDEKEELVNLG